MTLDEILGFQLLHLRGTPITVGSVLTVAVIVAVGWLVSTLIRRSTRRAWLKRGTYDARNIDSLLRLLHYGIVLITLSIALETIGVDLSTLFAAGAIFAIGIGFAMQNVMQNFVSGVILLGERTIRPGDVLEIDGTVVRIEEMGMRSTRVRTRFEEEMIVPNSILVTSTIKNFTLRDPLFRVRTGVGVAYASDLKVVFKALEHTARTFSGAVEGKDPLVLLTEFGSSSVHFEVSVWTDDPWSSRRLLSQLNEAIWWALKDAGVTIAFPQQDIHLDPDVVDALRGSRAPGPARGD